MPSPRRLALALAAVIALAACSSSTEDAPADARPGVGGTDLEAPAPNAGRTNLENPDAGGS